jgi:hypothetical protein
MATIFVAILLLAILTVVTLFALSVGVFEQRTATNDNRARVVAAASEAGLNQGIEFFKANKRVLVDTWMYPPSGTSRRWTLCTSTETSFPCGAETDTTRRARLWRYTDTNNSRADNTGTTDSRRDPRALHRGHHGQFRAAVGHVGDRQPGNTAFSVDYDVGALLCMIDTTTNQCVTTLNAANPFRGRLAVTLVSKARLTSETGTSDTESAKATHKVTISIYPAINGTPNAPVIASGAVVGLGSAEIVPNENAGGFGVPISIWSNDNADFSDDSGAAQSCHLGEFQSNYSNGNNGAADTYCPDSSNNLVAVSTSQPATCGGITVCTKCKCDGLTFDRGMISGKANAGGGGNNRREGNDVLDIEATAPTAETNTSMLPNPSCDGTHFFFPYQPCDLSSYSLDDSLFEYVFGQENSAESDSALEDVDNNGRDDGDDWMLSGGAFEGHVISTDDECAPKLLDLGPSAGGFYFIERGVTCNLNNAANGQLGQPKSPVAIVVDGEAHIGGTTTIFGMLFIKRYKGTDGATHVGYARINGNGTIIGSMVVENATGDTALNITGSIQVVYNQSVLNNLANDPANGGVGRVPGSWSDSVTLN